MDQLDVNQMILSVLIPTFLRHDDLLRCLRAVAAQERVADEVVVVVRAEDSRTLALLRSNPVPGLPVRVVLVDQPGLVHALQRATEEATGNILAFTDDDTAPRPDWLGRIEAHFADDDVAGVGGRDLVHELGVTLDGTADEVGRLRWYGKFVGNHHVGHGPPREVDALKGANMAYRRELVRQVGFDTRLRGTGAQVANEIALALPLRRAGWRLIYDPAVLVDHYPSVRHDDDKRYVFRFNANVDAVHNETLPVLEHLSGLRKFCFVVWAWTVGTRRSWGLVQALRFLPTTGFQGMLQRLLAGWCGRRLAWRTHRMLPRYVIASSPAAGVLNRKKMSYSITPPTTEAA